MANISVTSPSLSAACMRQWIRSALVQYMPCRLFGHATPLSKSPGAEVCWSQCVLCILLGSQLIYPTKSVTAHPRYAGVIHSIGYMPRFVPKVLHGVTGGRFRWRVASWWCLLLEKGGEYSGITRRRTIFLIAEGIMEVPPSDWQLCILKNVFVPYNILVCV